MTDNVTMPRARANPPRKPVVEKAAVGDADAMLRLVNDFAGRGEMLPRSAGELFETLRTSLINSGIPHIDTHLPMIASTKAYDNPWKQPRSQRARWTRVAEREGRIRKPPRVVKPPKDLKSAAQNREK